ncbi:MAG: YitT family protein [Clostridia bacterium]|nr:YitT family protein [Clostridia bacterium]
MKSVFKHFYLLFATLIFSFGFNVFLRPAGIAPGGISGISLLINYLFPALPVGILTLIFNLPLFFLGFKKIGKEFVLKSAIASVFIAIFLDLYPFFPVIDAEPLVAAIFGGVIMGAGMGLAFLSGGSTGGVDILIRVLRNYHPQLSIGQLLLFLDAIVVIASGIVYKNINNSLYAMVTMYAASVSLDGILYGLNFAKCALIITNNWDVVNEKLLTTLERGTTLIPCIGGYGKKERRIILCAIRKSQLITLKELVYSADKEAFVIMCDANEVLGLGFNYHNKNTF